MTPAEKRLERAKRAVNDVMKPNNRKWLEASVMSYGGDSYVSRLHVLEGTPPHAYIVENAEREVCTALDGNGQLLGEARYGEYEPARWVPMGRKRIRGAS